MGTNFYLSATVPLPKPFDHLHIGKSSAGWCFALHVFQIGDDPRLPRSWKEWQLLFSRWGAETRVADENNNILTVAEFSQIVTERVGNPEQGVPFQYESWEQFHLTNRSEFGPNHLVRAKIDGIHCVGHGDGPWDLIIGEFG